MCQNKNLTKGKRKLSTDEQEAITYAESIIGKKIDPDGQLSWEDSLKIVETYTNPNTNELYTRDEAAEAIGAKYTEEELKQLKINYIIENNTAAEIMGYDKKKSPKTTNLTELERDILCSIRTTADEIFYKNIGAEYIILDNESEIKKIDLKKEVIVMNAFRDIFEDQADPELDIVGTQVETFLIGHQEYDVSYVEDALFYAIRMYVEVKVGKDIEITRVKTRKKSGVDLLKYTWP